MFPDGRDGDNRFCLMVLHIFTFNGQSLRVIPSVRRLRLGRPRPFLTPSVSFRDSPLTVRESSSGTFFRE